MQELVVDSSVILKWCLTLPKENHTQDALSILDGFVNDKFQIALPSIWRYEIGNVLLSKQPALAKKIMTLLLNHGFQEYPLDNDFCLQIIQFGYEISGISYYDAAYHVLAMRLNSTLITADQKYYRKTYRKGHICYIGNWMTVLKPE